MGCCSGKATPVQARIHCVEQVEVNAGTLVVANEHEFQQIYRLGRRLGAGGFGEVRMAMHRRTNAQRAVKIFRKRILTSLESVEKMREEIRLLKSLDHPNIVRVYEFFEDDKRLYIVMEYCRGGELFDELVKRQTFTEELAAQIMTQLFSAVHYMHSRNIIHRDLKPENILLDEREHTHIKIIDFGTATLCEKERTVCGTQGTCYYVAPEVLSSTYNEKCDLWSCGVILYILLSGTPPFDGHTDEDILEKIKRGNYSFAAKCWQEVSEPAKDLIKQLLCPATLRLSAAQALQHPWIVSQSKAPSPVVSMGNILSNLQAFRNRGKLRDAVQTYLATQYLSTDCLKELQTAFLQIDTNKDGKISRSELLAVYLKRSDFVEAEEEVDKIMRSVDTDNNGHIDYSEFLKAATDIQRLITAQNLRAAFDLFDTDDNGSISTAEVRRVLEGERASNRNVWTEIIREFDDNGDGELDFAEFEAIVCKNL